MGGGNQKAQTTLSNNAPWSVQTPYLTQAFNSAQGAMNQSNAVTPYSGDFVANPIQEQFNAFRNAYDFAQNNQNLPGQATNTGTQLSNQGVTGTRDSIAGLFGLAQSDLAGDHLGTAQRYAQNPYIGDMVQAAMRDSTRAYTEGFKPQQARAAAISGNNNSTRGEISRGIAERGLQEKALDISAGMRGDAFNQGLSHAQQDTATRMGAFSNIGSLSGDAAKTGLFGLASGVDMGGKLADIGSSGATGLYGLNQLPIDNALAKYDFSKTDPFTALNQYYNIVGANNWGSQGSEFKKTKEDPSTMSTVGSVVGMLGSLFKCDRSAKENVSQVGTMAFGIPVYSFNYRDDPEKTPMIGPMADEYGAIFPEAIVNIDGFDHIDVSKGYDWRT
jgi:hypothetical protein